MDDKQTAALEASIEHWQKNATAAIPAGASVSGADCALCRVNTHSCKTCPVFERTGQGACEGTHYYEALRGWHRWKHTPLDAKARQAFQEAAQHELDFLISLREPAP